MGSVAWAAWMNELLCKFWTRPPGVLQPGVWAWPGKVIRLKISLSNRNQNDHVRHNSGKDKWRYVSKRCRPPLYVTENQATQSQKFPSSQPERRPVNQAILSVQESREGNSFKTFFNFLVCLFRSGEAGINGLSGNEIKHSKRLINGNILCEIRICIC